MSLHDDYLATGRLMSLYHAYKCWHVHTTARLRSCEYSKNKELCMIKIHYTPMILYLNYINRKTFSSVKQDQNTMGLKHIP